MSFPESWVQIAEDVYVSNIMIDRFEWVSILRSPYFVSLNLGVGFRSVCAAYAKIVGQNFLGDYPLFVRPSYQLFANADDGVISNAAEASREDISDLIYRSWNQFHDMFNTETVADCLIMNESNGLSSISQLHLHLIATFLNVPDSFDSVVCSALSDISDIDQKEQLKNFADSVREAGSLRREYEG